MPARGLSSSLEPHSLSTLAKFLWHAVFGGSLQVLVDCSIPGWLPLWYARWNGWQWLIHGKLEHSYQIFFGIKHQYKYRGTDRNCPTAAINHCGTSRNSHMAPCWFTYSFWQRPNYLASFSSLLCGGISDFLGLTLLKWLFPLRISCLHWGCRPHSAYKGISKALHNHHILPRIQSSLNQ